MAKKQLIFLEKRKKQIDLYIKQLINEQREIYNQHSVAKATFDYLDQFLIAGKTVRGGLFLEFLSVVKPDLKSKMKQYLPIAAALELIHSSLLIQDDYMDQDSQRRGMITFFSQRLRLARLQQIKNPKHYATSALLCATDVCFFIAFGEIAKSVDQKRQAIFNLLSQEYSHLGFAQWEEVLLGKKQSRVNLKAIKTIYQYKTARYTFTVPIILAALLADLPEKDLILLDQASEALGMVFQITDDQLSLFGDPKITGKNLGNDIIENKKTFHLYFLTQALRQNKNQAYRQVLQYFGQTKLSQKQIEATQKALRDLKIVQKITQMIEQYEVNFMSLLDQTSLNLEAKKLLLDLFSFVKNREG